MDSKNTQDVVLPLKSGSLLLKQESNGLHFRWIVLNASQDTIYWLNPKKESLIIDRSNSFQLSDVAKIIIGPDFSNFIPEGQENLLDSLSVTSFRISFILPGYQVNLYCPLYHDFQQWVQGLNALFPPEQFEQMQLSQDSMSEIEHLISGDPEALRLRLGELVELADSLLKESAALMEVRSKREYCIAVLYKRIAKFMDELKSKSTAPSSSSPDSSLVTFSPSSAQKELDLLRRQNQSLEGELRALQQMLASADSDTEGEDDDEIIDADTSSNSDSSGNESTDLTENTRNTDANAARKQSSTVRPVSASASASLPAQSSSFAARKPPLPPPYYRSRGTSAPRRQVKNTRSYSRSQSRSQSRARSVDTQDEEFSELYAGDDVDAEFGDLDEDDYANYYALDDADEDELDFNSDDADFELSDTESRAPSLPPRARAYAFEDSDDLDAQIDDNEDDAEEFDDAYNNFAHGYPYEDYYDLADDEIDDVDANMVPVPSSPRSARIAYLRNQLSQLQRQRDLLLQYRNEYAAQANKNQTNTATVNKMSANKAQRSAGPRASLPPRPSSARSTYSNYSRASRTSRNSRVSRGSSRNSRVSRSSSRARVACVPLSELQAIVAQHGRVTPTPQARRKYLSRHADGFY